MSHFQLITDNARWEGESNYFFASRNREIEPELYQYLFNVFSKQNVDSAFKMAGGEWSLRLSFLELLIIILPEYN